jgi:hypothetical protein
MRTLAKGGAEGGVSGEEVVPSATVRAVPGGHDDAVVALATKQEVRALLAV